MRTAIQPIRQLCLWVAALSMGLHFAVMQLVGWVNMTVEYSQTAPLAEALVMTFDGKHPCALCKLVAKEFGNTDPDDERSPEGKSEVKWPPVVCWAGEVPLPGSPQSAISLIKRDDRSRLRRERPPLLPPRVA